MNRYSYMYQRCHCSIKPKEYQFSDEQISLLENRLKLIGVKARLELLLLLQEGSHCVCDLTTHSGLSQSLISHHLADLQEACFITSKKEGKYVEFSLTENGKELLHALGHVAQCCTTDNTEGGDITMKQGQKGCDCKGCCEEVTEETKALSKEELLAKKAELEKQLKEVDETLNQSATETA